MFRIASTLIVTSAIIGSVGATFAVHKDQIEPGTDVEELLFEKQQEAAKFDTPLQTQSGWTEGSFQKVGEIKDSIVGGTKETLQKVGDKVGDVQEGVQSKASDLKEGAQERVQGLQEGVKNSAYNLKKGVQERVQGLQEGVQDRAHNLKEGVKDSAYNLKE
eukprot:gene31477-35536_t